ncbi:MAG: TerC family protein [Sphingobacteriales bacterium]|jgi:predicted tellurium resistance membrane protein TerC|nr:TerC family protein [Sphingobacteriales bacterium]MBP9142041.1 TerC family protein [Chitinophagales bacterium]MDA0198159.1 TerC family protein [Bacteroidota bacterium]MBK6889625.1 TerC family protein [Sphingobacteriales bacterium]MBK7527864.1 TerC family protein [Sphingobacteriales bacterium]
MAEILTSAGLISLITLTFMEIVLGIDNLVFLSILSGRLPKSQQSNARRIGLVLALAIRIGLLFSISWIVSLKEPVFNVHIPIANDAHLAMSWRDIILFLGGIFLLYKSTNEIHQKIEGEEHHPQARQRKLSFNSVIFQIVMLDIVFSFDSILTAVGLVQNVTIMIIAVVISMVVMIIFADSIAEFINRHPSMKVLALAFLLLIGFMLVFEGLHSLHHQEVPKGYIYFAIFFSLAVELLNIRMRKKQADIISEAHSTDTAPNHPE